MTAPTLEFQLSPDFRRFPLADDSDGDPVLGVLAASYRAAGVVFAANLECLVDGRPAIGHFTVTIEPFEDVEPRTAALGIAEILSAGQPAEGLATRAVKLVRLPCGPAVATEELREVVSAADPAEVQLAQAQVYVKPAGCAGLVVLTMATLVVCDLPWYTSELALVAQSLRFS